MVAMVAMVAVVEGARTFLFEKSATPTTRTQYGMAPAWWQLFFPFLTNQLRGYTPKHESDQLNARPGRGPLTSGATA